MKNKLILSRMKNVNGLYVLSFFLLLCFNLVAQEPSVKRWFVDNNATGLNNGTSWTNAFQGFDHINYTNIDFGDTIFISGGDFSKIYNLGTTITKSGITITKGIGAGHNGEVILQALSQDTLSGTAFMIRDVNSVTISNLSVKNWAMSFEIDGNYEEATYNITVENIKGIFNGRFLRVGGYPNTTGTYCHDITIRNNTLTTPSLTELQTDFIYAQYMRGLVIDNNDVTIRANDLLQHDDMVQTFWARGPIIVKNNIFKNLNIKQAHSQGIFFENHYGDHFIYNNVIVQFGDTTADGNTGGKIYFKNSTLNEGIAYVYGNTVYGSNGDFVNLNTSSSGSIIKNNIFWTFGRIGGTLSTTSIVRVVLNSGTTISENLFYDMDNSMTNISNSGTNGTNYEANPLFINRSTLNFTLQSTSPAIDAGALLLSPFNYDILGVMRPIGAGYDIGAYEFNDNGVLDMIPPELINAEIIDSVNIILEFSEPMNETLLNNSSNYSISNGIVVNTVNTLNSSSVQINTSVHLAGSYQVTCNNLTDIAGNVISSNSNSLIYEYTLPNTYIQLPVASVLASVTPEPNHPGEKTLDGKGYYQGDPDSRWAGDTMPEWLVYDLGDIQILNKTQLSFFNWNEGRIYNYSLQVSVDSIIWTEIRSNVPSIASEWSAEEFSPVEARYVKIIFIANNQSAWAGLWEAEFYGHLKLPTNYEEEDLAPVEFTLEQNYPNPFNPATSIQYAIRSNQFVQLKVYDVIGNEIATLVNEFIPAGKYEVEFNAENLASGVYIYRIQTETFTDTKKMVLLR
ncbi:MAG: discoidin domain-containing protein [Ignavibacteriaceae bacterium]